eukprot:TRINITY_DN15288_c0_g1_i2.p1 TRINITY_DN15288_c0_g1~~TRINITY_DN15288_c0_g1_i2.p1  ORF type:complete len:859 (+),score=173.16 TRINITY_DN15288_c0_g1_i2:35-2611(+)
MHRWPPTRLLAAVSFAAAILGSTADIDVKARVERGEGVPFFDERLGCRDDDGVWSDFRELLQYSRLRIFEADEGPELASLLTKHLAARTSNVTEILQCNVGIVAGFHQLARYSASVGEDWRAYRLLQLAMIWVFTLRNGIEVPEEAAKEWATRSDLIAQEIRLLRGRLRLEQERRLTRLPYVSPTFRQPGLRVAVVSICAYPEDHPLVLRLLTPENRRAYADRHGYSLHVHMEHPMPNLGVHIQHAKLALVAGYLRSGKYDWVAWLDCDSIIMNMNKTLDAVIHRYARRSVRPHAHSRTSGGRSLKPGSGRDAVSARPDARATVRGGSGKDGRMRGAGISGERSTASRRSELVNASGAVDLDEPLADEELQAIVAHIGSCNTEGGCWASTKVRVNRHTHYKVDVSTAQVDMEGREERLASISVGGRELGDCNPEPESDFDCGQWQCFERVVVPPEAVASGILELRVQSVKTSNDCHCSLIYGTCYSAALASWNEAAGGEKMTDPRYGMFVRFTLTPVLEGDTESNNTERSKEAAIVAESCKPNLENSSLSSPPGDITFQVVKKGAECVGKDMLLGLHVSLEECLTLCYTLLHCQFVIFGADRKKGQCFWEMSDCTTFEEDSYTVYQLTVRDVGSSNGSNPQAGTCDAGTAVSHSDREGIVGTDVDANQIGVEEDEVFEVGDDEDVDLLITEESWGLSSANWLIRASEWSIWFMEKAFELCHESMPLFGDQDAMIHLLFNSDALRNHVSGDPMEPRAIIIPQRELNSYDALNAHYMGCDAYAEGDLLVTFPGCKDAQACNPLFRMAAEYASGEGMRAEEEENLVAAASRRSAHLRLFGPPEEAAAIFEAARRARRVTER